MTNRSINLTIDGTLAVIRFNRHESRNALNLSMWRSLPDLVTEALGQKSVRAIMICGSGGHFAAGADISEFDTVFAAKGDRLHYLNAMQAATAAIEAAPVPVIAAIDGYCIGAGFAVALACDLRIAAQDARFAVTPARLGMVFSFSDTKRLVDTIGPSRAKEMLFTGQMIDASRALALGLVDELVPSNPEQVAIAHSARMAESSRYSVGNTKKMIHAIVNGMSAPSQAMVDQFVDAFDGPDYLEGVAAFRDRRKPKFS